MALAESLAGRSVASDDHGSLFRARVTNQHTLLVSLPMPVPPETQLTLRIAYGGRAGPRRPDRETLALGHRAPDPQPRNRGDLYQAPLLGDPNYLYSSRSYWYPQAPISDYSTAPMRISVPATLSCVGTGELASGSP